MDANFGHSIDTAPGNSGSGSASFDLTGRRETRHVTVLVNAGVSQGDRDGLCRIRNVSESGLAIETSVRMIEGQPARVQLHSGRILDCVARWIDGQHVGLSCAQVATEALREERPAAEDGAPQPALPRFVRAARTEIVIHGRVHACRLASISASDALIVGAPEVEHGQPVTLRVRGLDDQSAVVRGLVGDDLLVTFPRGVAFRTMDPWLAEAANR